jgi:hypothetical protein
MYAPVPLNPPTHPPTHPPLLQDEQDLVHSGLEALLCDVGQQRGQAILGKAVHARDQAVLQGLGWEGSERRQAGRDELWAAATENARQEAGDPL